MSFKIGDLVSVEESALVGNSMPSGLKEWVRLYPKNIFHIISIGHQEEEFRREYRLEVADLCTDGHPSFFYSKELRLVTPDWD